MSVDTENVHIEGLSFTDLENLWRDSDRKAKKLQERIDAALSIEEEPLRDSADTYHWHIAYGANQMRSIIRKALMNVKSK